MEAVILELLFIVIDGKKFLDADTLDQLLDFRSGIEERNIPALLDEFVTEIDKNTETRIVHLFDFAQIKTSFVYFVLIKDRADFLEKLNGIRQENLACNAEDHHIQHQLCFNRVHEVSSTRSGLAQTYTFFLEGTRAKCHAKIMPLRRISLGLCFFFLHGDFLLFFLAQMASEDLAHKAARERVAEFNLTVHLVGGKA